jgi:hypothetical protein
LFADVAHWDSLGPCGGDAPESDNIDMPVLAKFAGIVIRLLIDRTFGTRVHAFYGDTELVIGLAPLRVIQGDAPVWVRDWVLWWVEHHPRELLLGRKTDRASALTRSGQVPGQLVLAE